MSKCKFWPLDFDLEGEIYENPAWDLPGLRRKRGPVRVHRSKPRTRAARTIGRALVRFERNLHRYPVEIFSRTHTIT